MSASKNATTANSTKSRCLRQALLSEDTETLRKMNKKLRKDFSLRTKTLCLSALVACFVCVLAVANTWTVSLMQCI